MRSKPAPTVSPRLEAEVDALERSRASLYAANARYQREVGNGDARPAPNTRRPARRTTGSRRPGRPRSAARPQPPGSARDVPVQAEHAEVHERVAERRHLPVEDRRDARARIARPDDDRVVEAVVAVHDRWTVRSRACARARLSCRRSSVGRSRERDASYWRRQVRSWRSRKPSPRPKSPSPTRCGIDRVQLGEDLGQLEAHAAQSVGGELRVLRRASEHVPIDELHHEEGGAGDLGRRGVVDEVDRAAEPAPRNRAVPRSPGARGACRARWPARGRAADAAARAGCVRPSIAIGEVALAAGDHVRLEVAAREVGMSALQPAGQTGDIEPRCLGHLRRPLRRPGVSRRVGSAPGGRSRRWASSEGRPRPPRRPPPGKHRRGAPRSGAGRHRARGGAR